MAILSNWHTKQIDYVLAYTQADVECDNIIMKVPRGFEIPGCNASDYVLRLEKNLYGQKQAGRVWNINLVKRLLQIGFTQSALDECAFYRGKSIYVLYTDDSILASPDEQELDQIIEDMKGAGLDLTVEGDIRFLGNQMLPSVSPSHISLTRFLLTYGWIVRAALLPSRLRQQSTNCCVVVPTQTNSTDTLTTDQSLGS